VARNKILPIDSYVEVKEEFFPTQEPYIHSHPLAIISHQPSAINQPSTISQAGFGPQRAREPRNLPTYMIH
jgi:hypothetical protein